MDGRDKARLKRQIQQMDFSCAVLNAGDWPIIDWWDGKAPQRDFGWLLAEVSGTYRHNFPLAWPPSDLLDPAVCDALHLPRGEEGLTFSYALRLIRRNLNRLGLPSNASALEI